MKKFIVLILLAIVCLQFSAAQDSNKKVLIKPGISIGFGLFYPRGVNDWIQSDLSGYIATNEDLYLNLFLRGSLGIQLNKVITIEPVLETALAPKLVIGVAGKSLIFGRVSTGILANFYTPMSKGRSSFFLGGGALYHYMWFKDYSGSTIGPAFQLGLSFNRGRSFNPEVFAGFNYAKAMGKYNGFEQFPSELELSYTDFHIGFRANF